MYQPFHRLRVRFAEMELRQGDVAQAAGMAKSTMTARMKGYQPWTSDEITRVAAVLNIPREQIGEFFFEPSPKSLTDTMRRSLCQQLDEEFHRCEWVQIIKQATRQGWLKFYPLDKDKPASTVPEFESAGDQISRIINDLKRKNGVIE